MPFGPQAGQAIDRYLLVRRSRGGSIYDPALVIGWKLDEYDDVTPILLLNGDAALEDSAAAVFYRKADAKAYAAERNRRLDCRS